MKSQGEGFSAQEMTLPVAVSDTAFRLSSCGLDAPAAGGDNGLGTFPDAGDDSHSPFGDRWGKLRQDGNDGV